MPLPPPPTPPHQQEKMRRGLVEVDGELVEEPESVGSHGSLIHGYQVLVNGSIYWSWRRGQPLSSYGATSFGRVGGETHSSKVRGHRQPPGRS